MAGKKGSKHYPVEVKQVETARQAASTCILAKRGPRTR